MNMLLICHSKKSFLLRNYQLISFWPPMYVDQFWMRNCFKKYNIKFGEGKKSLVSICSSVWSSTNSGRPHENEHAFWISDTSESDGLTSPIARKSLQENRLWISDRDQSFPSIDLFAQTLSYKHPNFLFALLLFWCYSNASLMLLWWPDTIWNSL